MFIRLAVSGVFLICSVGFCQQNLASERNPGPLVKRRMPAADPDQGAPPAGWTATAPLLEPRSASCAVRLTDGRILVTGGKGINGDLASTEFYLPQGSFVAGTPMNATRSGHTCTLLNDGRVLVAGGDTDGAGSAEVYDPVLDTWQFVAGDGQARHGHTATLLPEGQVLIAAGQGAEGPLASIQIFDPQSNSLISSNPALIEARTEHAAVQLADGRVLLVGGAGASGPLSSTEIFDPHDFSIVPGPQLSTARAGHSATRLDDGRILVAGGSDGSKETDTAEILAPGAGAWMTLNAHLNTARRDFLSILIPGNGGVLIAGGLENGQPLGDTELFLPVENVFLKLRPLTLARSSVAVAAIEEGLILAAGGLTSNGPQRACGVLQVPAIHFTKPVYHIPETASMVLSSFPVSVNVTFNLSVAPGSTIAAANTRLLTPSVTVAANSTQVVPIVLTRFQDAGLTIRLTATAANAIAAVATAQVHNATSLTLALPSAVYEGANVSPLALLSRGASSGTMTGTLNMGVAFTPSNTNGSSFTDGTSNTIQFGETAPNTTTTAAVNTSGSAATVQTSLTSLAPGSVSVSANYSGDVGNDAASASGNFSVVSKTPRVQLSTSMTSSCPGAVGPCAQVGTPFSVSASVATNGTVSSPQPFTGTLALLQSGFPVLGQTSLSTPSGLFSTATITPLTLNPISLSANYSGDSFFRNASSLMTTVTVQKANPTLTINSAPSTYTCGQPSNFTVTLSYPVALGLTNRSVSLQTLAQDGSVRAVSAVSTSPLQVATPGAKDVSAKATATIAAFLPLDIRGVSANFSGDSLLNGAVSATVNPTLQLSPVTIDLNMPATVTNPAAPSAVVNAATCSVPPTGSVEFLDGQASLGVVMLSSTNGQILPFIEQGNASNFNSPSSAIATLTVSRPPGVHNISVRYSGDNHYQPATSAVVAVTFQ